MFCSLKVKVDLRKHVKARHEGHVFSCDDCNYVTPRRPDLKRHRQSKHENANLQCDQCEHVSRSLPALKHHIREDDVEIFI